MESLVYNVKNVRPEVRKAIARYCNEQGITQARYLAEDKRIKSILKELVIHS